MGKQKIQFRFHNPNSAEDTARYLEKLFIEVNACKVRMAIEAATHHTQENIKEALPCV